MAYALDLQLTSPTYRHIRVPLTSHRPFTSPTLWRSDRSLPTRMPVFFFLNNAAPPEFSPLPLHAALPISMNPATLTAIEPSKPLATDPVCRMTVDPDRKSTRLNSSHLGISYAVFCLK